MFKRKDSNLYLDIFEYAREQLNADEGVKKKKLVDYLKNNGYGSVDEEGTYQNRTLRSCLANNFDTYGKPNHESEFRHYLTPEAYFSLLNYDNFRHSVKSSWISFTTALAAIVISIVGIFVSVVW